MIDGLYPARACAILLLAAGCAPSPVLIDRPDVPPSPGDCASDCDSALTVRLQNAPAGSLAVEVQGASAGGACALAASGILSCDGDLSLTVEGSDLVASMVVPGPAWGERIALRVTVDGATLLDETEVDPGWSEPAEDACGIGCSGAEVVRDLGDMSGS